MRAYVTGIAGFLGRHVAYELYDAGWEVFGCDNHLTSDPVPGLEYEERDIRDLKPGELFNYDRVFHLAAIARSAWDDDDELVSVNVHGTNAVINASPFGSIIGASSSVSALPHINTYAMTKDIAESLIMDSGGVALRYSNIYGAGQSLKGAEPNVLAAWKRQIEEDRSITIYGDGMQVRDFIHVTDAAKSTVAAVSRFGAGSVKDICTGVHTSLNAIAQELGVRIVFEQARKNDPVFIPQDCSQNPHVPRVTFLGGAGFKEVVEWMDI